MYAVRSWGSGLHKTTRQFPIRHVSENVFRNLITYFERNSGASDNMAQQANETMRTQESNGIDHYNKIFV